MAAATRVVGVPMAAEATRQARMLLAVPMDEQAAMSSLQAGPRRCCHHLSLEARATYTGASKIRWPSCGNKENLPISSLPLAIRSGPPFFANSNPANNLTTVPIY